MYKGCFPKQDGDFIICKHKQLYDREIALYINRLVQPSTLVSYLFLNFFIIFNVK